VNIPVGTLTGLIKTVTEIAFGMNFCKEEDTMEDTISLMSLESRIRKLRDR
jgi:hypothetical protein